MTGASLRSNQFIVSFLTTDPPKLIGKLFVKELVNPAEKIWRSYGYIRLEEEPFLDLTLAVTMGDAFYLLISFYRSDEHSFPAARSISVGCVELPSIILLW